MTDMAAPRSSTALAKTAGTARRLPARSGQTQLGPTQLGPTQLGQTQSPKKIARKPATKAASKPAPVAAASDVAQLLEDLRSGGEALTARIARLAHRFL
jgi:hypothetical protein